MKFDLVLITYDHHIWGKMVPVGQIYGGPVGDWSAFFLAQIMREKIVDVTGTNVWFVEAGDIMTVLPPISSSRRSS